MTDDTDQPKPSDAQSSARRKEWERRLGFGRLWPDSPGPAGHQPHLPPSGGDGGRDDVDDLGGDTPEETPREFLRRADEEDRVRRDRIMRERASLAAMQALSGGEPASASRTRGDPDPDCRHCKGTGTEECRTCDGRGWYMGRDGERRGCIDCRQTGGRTCRCTHY